MERRLLAAKCTGRHLSATLPAKKKRCSRSVTRARPRRLSRAQLAVSGRERVQAPREPDGRAAGPVTDLRHAVDQPARRSTIPASRRTFGAGKGHGRQPFGNWSAGRAFGCAALRGGGSNQLCRGPGAGVVRKAGRLPSRGGRSAGSYSSAVILVVGAGFGPVRADRQPGSLPGPPDGSLSASLQLQLYRAPLGKAEIRSP